MSAPVSTVFLSISIKRIQSYAHVFYCLTCGFVCRTDDYTHYFCKIVNAAVHSFAPNITARCQYPRLFAFVQRAKA
jgi:hypothetical protein